MLTQLIRNSLVDVYERKWPVLFADASRRARITEDYSEGLCLI